jgi:hypothetical protein
VGSIPLGESKRSSCLDCCYGSPGWKAAISWRKLPLSYVEHFSVKWGLGTWGRCSRSTWVTWAHQDWGISYFIASLSYHAPRFGESTGLFAMCAWISPSRTGHPGPHSGTQSTLISASHPDYLISGCDTSRLTRGEWGHMEAQTTFDLTSLFPWPAGYIKPQETKVWRNKPHSPVFPGIH